jgi:hypothetical protein
MTDLDEELLLPDGRKLYRAEYEDRMVFHRPEHTPHDWRDFFTQITTIVIRPLIAVGLEQAMLLVTTQQLKLV